MGTSGERHSGTNFGRERVMQMIRVSAFLVAALMSTSANALEPWTPTDLEMLSLPSFCKIKFKSPTSSPEYKMWVQTLGPDFMHTHHYCAGLNFLNRYYRSHSPQDKGFNLGSALNNFDYMVNHAAPTYSLMPDIYLNRGLTYSLMKRDAQAIADLNKSLEMNPHLVKTYNLLANYYEGAKQKQKALEIVTIGLQHNPSSKSLQNRYLELGGALPYPEPIQAVQAQPVVPEQALKIEAGVSAPAPASVSAPADSGLIEPIAQPKIGSPKNPYCRFCTD